MTAKVGTLGSRFFLFEIPVEPRDTTLVVFCGWPTIEGALLRDECRDWIELNSMPMRVLIVVHPSSAATIAETLEGDDFPELWQAATRYLDPPPLAACSFDDFGRLHPVSGDMGGFPHLTVLLDQVVRAGLLRLWDSRKGSLVSGPSFHYVNPSGRHTQRFLRTGNVLLYGAEVRFLAFSMLRWAACRPSYIVVDTASISSIAYALVALCKELDSTWPDPVIDSFSSYDGVKTLSFPQPAQTLAIVSASTSGNLVADMVDGGLPMRQIVTVFFGGAGDADQTVLCDLKPMSVHAELEPAGEVPRPNYRSGSTCTFCREGRHAIHISGDQFLPASPLIEPVTLRAAMVTNDMARAANVLIGRQAVRTHYRMHVGEDLPRTIYVRLAELLSDDSSEFNAALSVFLNGVTVPFDLLLHLEDPESRILASVVSARLRSAGLLPPNENSVRVVDWLRGEGRDTPLVGMSVLTVAGATESGRGLLSVSQALRRPDGPSKRAYLIGVAKVSSPKEQQRLESDLGFGSRAKEYPVSVLERIVVQSRSVATPWTLESAFLDLLEGWFLGYSPQSDEAALPASVSDLLAEVGTRRTQLRDALLPGGPGLLNDLFWPAASNSAALFGSAGTETLRVRRGFAFWPVGIVAWDQEAASQADVFSTVVALLQSLRLETAGEDALAQYEHNRRVLSPTNFSRFNDGAIQAAILRAALPGELDYSGHLGLSHQMSDLLVDLVSDSDRQLGEAVPEFIYALASGRMRLEDADDNHVWEAVAYNPALPPLLRTIGLQGLFRRD